MDGAIHYLLWVYTLSMLYIVVWGLAPPMQYIPVSEVGKGDGQTGLKFSELLPILHTAGESTPTQEDRLASY